MNLVNLGDSVDLVESSSAWQEAMLLDWRDRKQHAPEAAALAASCHEARSRPRLAHRLHTRSRRWRSSSVDAGAALRERRPGEHRGEAHPRPGICAKAEAAARRFGGSVLHVKDLEATEATEVTEVVPHLVLVVTRGAMALRPFARDEVTGAPFLGAGDDAIAGWMRRYCRLVLLPHNGRMPELYTLSRQPVSERSGSSLDAVVFATPWQIATGDNRVANITPGFVALLLRGCGALVGVSAVACGAAPEIRIVADGTGRAEIPTRADERRRCL